MFRLRFISPFKCNNSLLFKRTFKFSSENKPTESKPNQIFPEEAAKKSEAEAKVAPKVSNPINPPRYQQDQGKSFLNKLDRIEEAQRFGGRSRRDLKTLILPALLCLTSVFLYHCWLTLPYSSIYKHATINEYINQMGYYHAIFLSSLSFQNMGHFVLYFPMMVYSLLLVSKYVKQRHVALIYVTNSLITAGATYFFEKYNKDAKLLTPKVNGSVTPLCFMTCFFVMKPNYFVFGSRLFPYFFLPFIYYMNEWNEYQIGEINEVSRPVHFTSIAWGAICGMAIRMLIAKRIV